MRQNPARPCYVSALVERSDNTLLIVLPPSAEGARKWMFPRGLSNPGESAEAAMRRVAENQLGLMVELVIGQPPIITQVDGRMAEVRYFFCGIATGELRTADYSEFRWVSKAHLQEYDFDEPSKPVVEWLLTS